MKRVRARHFRMFAGGLAVLGAVLNVWVLTVHLTSVALTGLKADADGIVICHRGGITRIAELGGQIPISKKHCPICSGFATLHLGVLSAQDLHVALLATPMALPSETITARVIDRRLHRILNRGPPLLI